MRLRKYQEACINDCLAWIKKSIDPAVVAATVSFGKSLVIAELARRISILSDKKVLILCPNGTLAGQNAEKLKAIGAKYSIFSASLGQKCIKNNVVVGTPLSVKNNLNLFGSQFAAILIDEGDAITNSVREIAKKIRSDNKLMRLIGFTGTPYRTQTGYIYQIGLDDMALPEEQCIEPYYKKLVHRTSTSDLMAEGYLTPLLVGDINAESYDTSHLQLNKLGQFDAKDIDIAYHGHGRKTAAIVGDIVRQSAGKRGVMIFGATVQHCREIIASLPPGISGMVASGELDNAKVIKSFREQKIKYIVNRDMLTVGCDFPHVDVIAVLRKTESARLLTQIIGRGLRLHNGNAKPTADTKEARKEAIKNGPKPSVLYLDYTSDNFDTHFPDGDIFSPKIKAMRQKLEGIDIKAKCQSCGAENTFTARPNEEGYLYDESGYFLDLDGNQVETEYGPMPGHYGRRCRAHHQVKGGKLVRCSQRWTFKECPGCGVENDIAARYCASCKGEIVNPGDRLVAEFKAMKKDPTQWQTDKVLDWHVSTTLAKSGRECIRVDYVTEYRSISVWYTPDSKHPDARMQLAMHEDLDGEMPKTITYRKEPNGFYRIAAYNQPEVTIENQKLKPARARPSINSDQVV